MPETEGSPELLSRRTLLKLGGVSAAAVAGVAALDHGPAGPALGVHSALASAPGGVTLSSGDFRIEIDGVPLDDAHEVRFDPVLVDLSELDPTEGHRVYGPGDAHYGSITVRSRVGKESRELYQWWLDCSRGQNIRKSISVICLKRDGSEARRFNALECYPAKWDPGDYSPSSNVACETIVCKMGRVELG